MSQNPEFTLDAVRDMINKIKLSPTRHQEDYYDNFYDHLTGLIKYRILGPFNDVDELKFTFKQYRGLEQYAFENSTNVEDSEPQDIDWAFIDESKSIIVKHIEGMLGREGQSEHLRPLKLFTADMFENWLIYKQLHPLSKANPWLPTRSILTKGYIYLVSDSRDQMEQYNPAMYKNRKDEHIDLGIVAKSDSRKQRGFGGFLADKRLNVQGMVYDYLKREAGEIRFAKTVSKISQFLLEQQRSYTDQQIKFNILLPLKRSGLIGSSTTGFYAINTISDLVHAYIHHKEKLIGLQKTVYMYEEKAKKMGVPNLNDYINQRRSGFIEEDYL